MGIGGTYLQGITTVVHKWEEIDFANYVYSRIRFGRGGPPVVVNGTPITQIAGLQIDILIDEKTTFIENGRSIQLFGNPKPVFNEYENEISKSSFYFSYRNNESFGCGVPPIITTDLTISIWAKPETDFPPAIPGDGYMVDTFHPSGRGYALIQDRLATTSVWSFIIGTTIGPGPIVLQGTTEIIKNEWAHICGVWNDATNEMKIYLNGVLDNSSTLLPQTLMDSGQPLQIGAGNTTLNEFNGFLNNCRIWNASLTSEEVLEVFNNGVTYNINGLPNSVTFPQSSSLVGWWKLGDDAKWDGSLWQMPDQIGTNDGTGTASLDFPARKVDAPGKFLSE